MRSGPATRTALACVNLSAAPARARLPASEEDRLSATVAHHHSKVWCILIALAGRSPAMRDRSEEAATPGCPQRFHVWEPLGSSSFLQRLAQTFRLARRTLKRTAAEPTCAITGGVSFTPAVIALSLIVKISSTEITGAAVRKLWTTNVVCGSQRKTGNQFPGMPKCARFGLFPDSKNPAHVD
jgi:hypothetical protein